MDIKRRIFLHGIAVCTALSLLLAASGAEAAIDGLTRTGTTPIFNLSARADHIGTADGGTLLIWGFTNKERAQYPAPTLIVNQGATVRVRLTNYLPEPVSIVFPGHQVTARGGQPGLLTREAPADNGATTVVYTFVASEPGTYTYYSGTHPDLQVAMGLFGAIIVRPSGYDPLNKATWTAYGDARSAYDHEYLFLLSEIDYEFNQKVEFGLPADTTDFRPVYWFINGRVAPDVMAPAGSSLFPTQPYNCVPRATPGERVLLRIVGGGRDAHPLHTHGNNFDLIARDGRLLESTPGAAKNAAEVGTLPDRAVSDFTQTVSPGATYDALYAWTGKNLGWDVYGDPGDPMFAHSCSDGNADGYDDTTYEWCADHGKPLPVTLPLNQDLTFGGFYSGSPFLGAMGELPVGEGGLNMNAGFMFMWHSHNEKELTNNDIFPGGLMSMFLVEPPGTEIP